MKPVAFKVCTEKVSSVSSKLPAIFSESAISTILPAACCNRWLLYCVWKKYVIAFAWGDSHHGQKSYEILAKIGDFDENHSIFTENLFEQLEAAGTRAISRLNGDTYIAYFPSQSGKSSLLVLQGLEQISEMDLKLLEVFSNNVAIAFDNVLINHDAAIALLS